MPVGVSPPIPAATPLQEAGVRIDIHPLGRSPAAGREPRDLVRSVADHTNVPADMLINVRLDVEPEDGSEVELLADLRPDIVPRAPGLLVEIPIQRTEVVG